MKTLLIAILALTLVVSGCCCCCPSGNGGDDWESYDWESQGDECTSDYDCDTGEYCSYGYCI